MSTLQRRSRLAVLLLALPAGMAIQNEPALPQPENPGVPAPIQAAGIGNPHVNFADGAAIPSSFAGTPSLAAALADTGSKGLALASADFDEDGMPDLAASYETAGGGILSLHFGNVDAVHPNAPEAKKRRAEGSFVAEPFLPDAKLFETPERPDHLGAGDFDADGHWDVVAARRGGSSLAYHRGDGAGGLFPPVLLPLPGAVTALATGDVNRRDGLEDILVGVDSPDGPRLLIFEWPEGALRGRPEVIDLPETAGDLSVGQLDHNHPIDVAVAAGRHLVLVSGRDRRLTLSEDGRSPSGPASAKVQLLPFEARSLAVGDFDAGDLDEVAILDAGGGLHLVEPFDVGLHATLAPDPLLKILEHPAARPRLFPSSSSSLAGEDLIVLDESDRSLLLLSLSSPQASGEAPGAGGHLVVRLESAEGLVAGLPMRLNPDALSDIVCLSGAAARLATLETGPLAIFTVTNTNNSGAGSLRAAITSANTSAGADRIEFNIPGSGPHVIQPLTSLPGIFQPVTIDGTTEPDFGTNPSVKLDGALAGDVGGLFVGADASTVRGLVVSRFSQSGIRISDSADCIVEGSYIGTDATGMSVEGNGFAGLIVHLSPRTRVGGTTSAARNIISGNGGGVSLFGTEVTVSGNYVGTGRDGLTVLGNGGKGISLLSSSGPTGSVVGGTSSGSRNVVCGNSPEGIAVNDSEGTLVQNNYVGVAADGSSPCGNSAGIEVLGADVTVGGTTPAARNVVGDNFEAGIAVRDSSTSGGVLVQGNYVGLNASGAAARPNGFGVEVFDTSLSVIGGTVSGARNVISGNSLNGIMLGLFGLDVDQVSVLGNYVGLNAAGTSLLPNVLAGIRINDVSGNRIGGASLAAANVISGNGIGIEITGAGASGNLVEVNLIGTDPAGIAAMGNTVAGIVIEDAPGNMIGVKQGQGNTIAGSPTGLRMTGAGATGNRLQGNRIGTNVNGTAALPNTDGLVLDAGASNNIIGGIFAETGNLISGNTGTGLVVKGSSSTGNDIRGNLIGTDITGTVALGNQSGGIFLDSSSGHAIGGPAVTDRNLVSANGNNLVLMAATATPSGNVVEGNYFGTDVSGSAPLGPGASNVALIGAAATIFRGNVVGGNHTRGLRIVGGANNGIHGNLFGVGPSMAPIGLSGPGIRIESSTGNLIGGIDPAESNVIANNSGDAVHVLGASSNNLIRGNSIDLNGGIGIDLDPDGVTPNDPGDGDTGPNRLQNFPVLTSAGTTGGSLTVSGTLGSQPGSFLLDVYASPACDPSGHGEGAAYVGSTTVVTDGSGSGSFTVGLTGAVPGGDFVTATATDSSGNTSEFSACVTAVGVPPGPSPTAVEFGSPLATSLSWEAVPGASQYNLYRGTQATFPLLATTGTDSCLRLATQSTGTGPVLTEVPLPGAVDWFLVTAVNAYGEGAVGDGDAGPRILNSSGPCSPSACAHEKCVAGAALAMTCDACVSRICQQDPFCCGNEWDSICVDEVRTICDSLTCAASAGQCPHTLCSQGVELTPGCDAPPIIPSCVTAICLQDPFCCNTGWDDICVGEVASICGFNCS